MSDFFRSQTTTKRDYVAVRGVLDRVLADSRWPSALPGEGIGMREQLRIALRREFVVDALPPCHAFPVHLSSCRVLL